MKNQIIQEAINNGTAQILTVNLAKKLKGKKIITKYFGDKGQNGVDEFVIGDILSEYDSATKNIDDKIWKQGSQAKYWESYMSKEKIQEKKETLELFTEDGRNTYIRAHSFNDGAFTCSDSDRFVYFIVE